MCCMKNFFDKYTFTFESVYLFCTTVNIFDNYTIYLINFWMKICFRFIGKVIKVIVYPRMTPFSICLPDLISLGDLVSKFISFLHASQYHIFELFLYSSDYKWDLLFVNFIILLHCWQWYWLIAARWVLVNSSLFLLFRLFFILQVEQLPIYGIFFQIFLFNCKTFQSMFAR